MAIALVALVVPVTSHSLLEDAGLIHDSGSDASDHDHDAADGLCWIESVGFHLEKCFQAVESAAAHFLFAALACFMVNLLPRQPKPDNPGTGPPLLLQSWQFSSRAALPARAPSLAS